MNKSINKKIIGRVFLYSVLVIFVVTFIFGRRGVGVIFALKRSNNQLQTKLDAIKAKNKQLAFEISSWERYPFYKEQLAREQLQLSYPGDIIYYVI